MSADGTPQKQKQSNRELARTGAIVVLAVFITAFALLNLEEVEVSWIFGKTHVPLIVVIVLSGLVGAALSYFLTRRSARRR
ncbi:MAG TPA: hypothetical protein VNV37_11620 [Solirubrobacteraceae bacterium]|jgi:uncharacterized integral membrane protein|nr:hypothetical protein [Solirubrobacteraceae bacterium]